MTAGHIVVKQNEKHALIKQRNICRKKGQLSIHNDGLPSSLTTSEWKRESWKKKKGKKKKSVTNKAARD